MLDTVINGVDIAPSVIETITGVAVNGVHGARVANSVTHGIPGFFQSMLMSSASQNVTSWSDDAETISLEIHITVADDENAVDVADRVREEVSNQILCQMGISVKRINIIIESMGEL